MIKFYDHLFLTSDKDAEGNPVVIHYNLLDNDYKDLIKKGVNTFDEKLASNFHFISEYNKWNNTWTSKLLSKKEI